MIRIKLTKEQLKELEKSIETAKQPDSLDIELIEDWEKYVAEPIIKHSLAPRQARAILDFFGTISDFGIKPMDIVEELLNKYVTTDTEIKLN